jgi:hypothetical protein
VRRKILDSGSAFGGGSYWTWMRLVALHWNTVTVPAEDNNIKQYSFIKPHRDNSFELVVDRTLPIPFCCHFGLFSNSTGVTNLQSLLGFKPSVTRKRRRDCHRSFQLTVSSKTWLDQVEPKWLEYGRKGTTDRDNVVYANCWNKLGGSLDSPVVATFCTNAKCRESIV